MITCIFENGNKSSLRHAVVHAIVEDKGKLLLVKRAGNLLESGKWSLPSGFMDRDETAGQTAIRELKEETSWLGEVTGLFSINTNPDRPKEDRQNIALSFIVKPIKKLEYKKTWEVSDIAWVDFKDMKKFEPFAFDHGETIYKYIEYQKKPFPLPLIY